MTIPYQNSDSSELPLQPLRRYLGEEFFELCAAGVLWTAELQSHKDCFCAE